MIRKLAASLTVILLFVSGLTGALAQSQFSCALLGASSGSTPPPQLVELNQVTGAVARVIGPLTVGIGGLAFHPITGVLYGVTAPGFVPPSGTPRNLVQIDPLTAQMTVVGPIGLGNFGIADLAFRADGTLFAWSENTDALITIDTATGAGTIVADAGISTFGSGLEFSSNGTLYLAGNGASGALRTVDPSTGLTTIVATLTGAPSPGEPINALSFHPDGTLYGVNLHFVAGNQNQTTLVVIDPTTGVVTGLGVPRSSLIRLDAIAFSCRPFTIPTLSRWAILMLMGLLAGFGWWRLARRRRLTA